MEEKQDSQQQSPTRRGEPGGKTRTWWVTWWISLTVAGSALVAVIVMPGNQEVPTTFDVAVETGAVANLEMQDFDGNTVTISDLEGGPAVINFWAAWCPACYAEMPAFQKVYTMKRESVQFLGINLSEDVESALKIADEAGVTYPLARDIDGEVFTAFGALGMPTTVFMDSSGNVIEMYTGELTASELEARIAEYFES
jgi:peroxiredoxin